jgi:hypothetical protein
VAVAHAETGHHVDDFGSESGFQVLTGDGSGAHRSPDDVFLKRYMEFSAVLRRL